MIWGGAVAVTQALRNGCQYRLTLTKRFDSMKTITNQLLDDSYRNPIREWQVVIELRLMADSKSQDNTYFSPHIAHPVILFTTSIHASLLHYIWLRHLSQSVLESPQANCSQSEWKNKCQWKASFTKENYPWSHPPQLQSVKNCLSSAKMVGYHWSASDTHRLSYLNYAVYLVTIQETLKYKLWLIISVIP